MNQSTFCYLRTSNLERPVKYTTIIRCFCVLVFNCVHGKIIFPQSIVSYGNSILTINYKTIFQLFTQRQPRPWPSQPSSSSQCNDHFDLSCATDPQKYELLADGRLCLGSDQPDWRHGFEGPPVIVRTCDTPYDHRRQSPLGHPDRPFVSLNVTVAVTGRTAASLHPSQAPDEKGSDEAHTASKISGQPKDPRQNENEVWGWPSMQWIML